MVMTHADVLVLGRGRVGCALTRALRRTGSSVTHVPAPRDAAGGIPIPSRLTVLAVPDGAIRSVAEALGRGWRQLDGEGCAVVHCSGVRGPEELQPVEAAGFATGAWHPLQAFATAATEVKEGIAWAITAADDVAGELIRRTGDLGGVPVRLKAEDRARYHAAAALAANHVTILVAHSIRLLHRVGVPAAAATDAVMALVRSGLDEVERHGPVEGLTGPLRRGDTETIERHLDALEGDPLAWQLYRSTAAAGLPLVAQAGFPPQTVKALAQLLAGEPPPGR